jgi:aryl-alcohol dehydrogenase-like predicted oxidoreductase
VLGIVTMQHRRIGSLQASLVGLGCNNFGRRLDERRTAEVVAAALDAGITFFDTADMYGDTLSEQHLGRALAGRRSKAVIATKFGWELDQEVREIGCSNFSAAQLQEAKAAVRQGAARFVSVQNEYSLLHGEPEREVLPACERLGIAFLPYFPLSSGLLSGKYRLGRPAPVGARIGSAGRFSELLSEQSLNRVEALIAFAEKRGRTILELAVSWLASRPQVASVIAGATSPEQVRANAAAADWPLKGNDLAEIDRILAQAT